MEDEYDFSNGVHGRFYKPKILPYQTLRKELQAV